MTGTSVLEADGPSDGACMPFDLIRAASALIAAPSSSDRGNLAVVPVVSQLAEQAGLSLEVIPSPVTGARDANLLVGLPGGTEREPLLLITHTDTVDSGPPDRWTVTAPLPSKIDGARLYGLGSADVKARSSAGSPPSCESSTPTRATLSPVFDWGAKGVTPGRPPERGRFRARPPTAAPPRWVRTRSRRRSPIP